MNLFNKKIILGGLFAGLTAFLFIYLDLHIRIPGTSIITDPREVFVLVSAALGGPVSAFITSFLAALHDPNSSLIPYIISQHVFAAIAISYLYKKIVYERLKMPVFLLGWIFLVFLYYFVLYIPVFYITYYFFPHTYFIITNNGGAPYHSLLKIFSGFVPEFIYTSVVTSLIWIALPQRLRKPIWGKVNPRYNVFQVNIEKLKHKLKLANNFLGLRLSVWFILLAILPLSLGAFYVRATLVELLKGVELKNRVNSLRDIVLFYDDYNANSKGNSFKQINLDGNKFYFFNEPPETSDSEIINRYGKALVNLREGKINFREDYAVFETQAAYFIIINNGNSFFVKRWTEDEYVKVINQFQAYTVIVVVFCLIIVSALAGFTIWIIVSRPLHLLSAAAEQLGKGNLDIKIDTAHLYDEMATLGETFNEMVFNLNKSREELIKAKLKAENSEKLKTNFLSQVSHEIRTPLNSIINYHDLIKEYVRFEDNSELIEAFGAIRRSANRIIRTIELILNMSDLELGIYEPATNRIPLISEIIKPLYERYFQLIDQTKVKLTLKTDNEEVYVLSDNHSLSQIFENVIDNAIKFTDEGSVEIIIYEEGDYVVCEIKDTGIGIGKKYLPEIFLPFSQEEHGYSRSYDGNGLGMAVVKQYCDLNKIIIEIDSEKGVGTSVKLFIAKA